MLLTYGVFLRPDGARAGYGRTASRQSGDRYPPDPGKATSNTRRTLTGQIARGKIQEPKHYNINGPINDSLGIAVLKKIGRHKATKNAALHRGEGD